MLGFSRFRIEVKVAQLLYKLGYTHTRGKTFIWSIDPSTGTVISYDFFVQTNSIPTIIQMDDTKTVNGSKVVPLVFSTIIAQQHGIRVIRLISEDVLKDAMDWRLLLTNALKAEIMVRFIANDPFIYEKHKDLYERSIDVIEIE